MGQEVINPVIAQAQSARGLLAQLLSRIGFPDTDEQREQRAEKLTRTRREAARPAHLRTIPHAR
jgi:hypothetical protein